MTSLQAKLVRWHTAALTNPVAGAPRRPRTLTMNAFEGHCGKATAGSFR